MPGWRLRARTVIRDVIAAHPELRGDLRAMRTEITDAYPFGMRRYTPYKEWLDEVAKAIDELATKPHERLCKVCGAKPWRPCRDVETGATRAVMHEHRLGRPEAAGPLFDTHIVPR